MTGSDALSQFEVIQKSGWRFVTKENGKVQRRVHRKKADLSERINLSTQQGILRAIFKMKKLALLRGRSQAIQAKYG